MSNNKTDRWYDTNENMAELLELIKSLPESARKDVANSFTHFVTIIRQSKDKSEERLVSLGKNRVLGLYKSSNQNRWYDSDDSIKKIMKLISTLEERDFDIIAEGFLKTLRASIE